MRDQRAIRMLRTKGWRVLTVWECEITKDRWMKRFWKCIGNRVKDGSS